MRASRTRKLLAAAVALVALGALWLAFAPPFMGGSTSYVVTDGISMQPRFHSGDLALVRSQSSYHVGEIVAYHNKQLGTVVLHRIVGMSGGRYVFKGDNNNFLDFEHPARSQLIGSLWLHLPGWGARLQSLHTPGLIAALVGFGVLALLGAAFVKRGRLRRRDRRSAAKQTPAPDPVLATTRDAGPMLAALIGGLTALTPFFVLALLAFTRPSSALAPVRTAYEQSGTLSYSAAATPGPAYAGNRASTGDPLFTHVIEDVQLRYDYRFASKASKSLAGKASLLAKITSTTGWRSTLPLGGPVYFRGEHAVVSGTLSLASLTRLLHQVETTTAVSGTYTLTIVPEISIGGSLGAVPLHTTFSSGTAFTLNRLEIRPELPPNATSTKPADPFTHASGGQTTGRSYQPTSLSLRFATLSVEEARLIAIVAILSIVSASALALVLLRGRRRSETSSIATRYGTAIVQVARVYQQPGVPVIDVEDMESLARIAEHYDRSILHEITDYGDAFWVTDESGQFRYVVSGAFEPLGEQAYAAESTESEVVLSEPQPDGYRASSRSASAWAEPVTLTHRAPA